MIYIPQKNNKNNAIMLLCGFFLLVFLMILTHSGIIESTICHFAFFFESIFYTFILAKFILPTYTYIVEENRFKIVKTIGNKTSRECDIDILNILEILSYKENKKQVNKKVRCVYNYNANFLSATCQCLIFEYSGICEAILFEPCKEMVSLIKSSKEN